MKTATTHLLDEVTGEHVDALAAGATLLGSGGGGKVALATQLLKRALREGSVPVRRAADMDPNARVVHVGVVGGPDVLSERLTDPRDLAAAARAIVQRVDGVLDAVGIIEIGGLNGVAGILAAHELGVPVIDGDLMGRAFPSINMTTLSFAGHHPAPLAVVGSAGDTVVVTTSSARTAEKLMAQSVAALGGAAALALFATTASDLVHAGVTHSVSACVTIGQLFLAAPHREPAVLAQQLGGRVLFEGLVDEIRPRMGAVPGSITLEDPLSGSAARLDLLEEFLAVTVDGVTTASTPEVIVALDSTRGHVLSADQVRAGQPLVLMSLPSLHDWPAEAATLVGPRAFGLSIEGGMG